jgi:tRNA pseudouridine65 synthase
MEHTPKILEENCDWLLVEKPAGLPVHATSQDEDDLLTLLSPKGHLYHAVHRLDRETSGLVLLAKTPLVASELMKIWTTDAVSKTYEAVLAGELRQDEGRWSWPLTDRAEGRRDPQGPKPLRKDSVTIFKVLEKTPFGTRLECEILTGRKHQIRRHAALARCPLWGDRRYGADRVVDPRYGMIEGRFALHSKILQVSWRGQTLRWTSEPPAFFKMLLTDPRLLA